MPSRGARTAVYLAFLASGVTALIYQIVWSRYLMLFVGGTSVAHTIVLATFMGGLAFGNAFFGRRADRPGADRLRQYALLELGIGLACLLFPTMFARVSQAYLALATYNGPGAAVNNVFKVALAAVSMFLPCAFMGGTLPVLAKYVVDSMSGLGVKIGWLYFVNTAGAVLGCVAGGFYVVEAWGLETGMVAAALVNIAIGGAFYIWSRRPRREPMEPAPASAAPVAPDEGTRGGEPRYTAAQARVAFWCIAVAGGVSMLYELAWTRVLILAMGGSVHSFSTMLISFISGIAIGSFIVGRLLRRPRNALALFGLCEVGIALSILLPLRAYERLPYAFHRVGSWLAHSPDTYGLFLMGQVLTAALIMLVPTTLIGAALPLASRVCVDALDVLGRRVGGVFSANTVGTVLGAGVTGFVLLPRLGVERTLLLGCTVSALLGVLLLRSWRPGVRPRPAAVADAVRASAPAQGPSLWAAAAGVSAVALALAALRPSWDPRLMQAGLFRWTAAPVPSWQELRRLASKDAFLYVKDGPDGTVAVQETAPLQRNIRVNGKVDASVGDMPTQLMVGHLPLFLHEDPQRAMLVGLGCGATAAAMLRHPGVRLDVAEISREMVEAAAFFDPWNDQVLRSPRLSLHVLDAREFLLVTREQYDVIVSEPTNIWIPGVANLFTRDFYQVVRSRLRPGGLFAQWMHAYLADPVMVASVVATLRTEFPYVSAWLVNDTDLIFVAGDRRPTFAPQRFVERFTVVEPGERIPSPPREVLAMLLHPVLLLAQQIGSGQGVDMAWPPGLARPYRDLTPRLEFEAARAQFVAGTYTVRKHLDERLRRVGTEPLFLEEYLALYPMDDRGRRALSELMANMVGHKELGTAVTGGLVLSGAADELLLARLPEPLLANLLLARALAGRLDRGSLDEASCQDYLRAEHHLLQQASSVFGRPAVGTLEARIERCMAGVPSAAEKLQAPLAKALADAGAAAPALRRIRAIEQRGDLTRLPPREAADLLVAGSVLLLQTPEREQALPWATQALALDPQNGTAARIVSALTPRRTAASPRLTARTTGP